MNSKFFNDLDLIRTDEEQWQAYNSSGNTVVIAGPGSGKTRVLTLKAMEVISHYNDSFFGIACLSFSRETVRELKKRLTHYGYKDRTQDFIGTVHSFCLGEILGPFSHLYPEYKLPDPFRIAPSKIINSIYNSTLEELKLDSRRVSKTDLERERYLSISGKSLFETVSVPEIAAAARLFEKKLIHSNFIDFTQIAKISTAMIQDRAYVRKSLEAKYPWMLIDEYQDLGKALHEMVLALYTNTDIKVVAVGDMDQSIYGFQGAYPEFLEELYKSGDFRPIQLRNNYRSNQDVINASITALNPPPPLPDYRAKLRQDETAQFSFIVCNAEMEEQYKCVTNKIIPKLIANGIPHSEMVVICGSNGEASDMANSFRASNIPCYLVRWSFDSNTDVVQWLLDLARWCEGSGSTSFENIARFWLDLLNIQNDDRSLWDEIRVRAQLLEVLENSKKIKKLHKWLLYIINTLEIDELLSNSSRYPDEKENLEAIVLEADSGDLKKYSRLRFTHLGNPENEVTVTTRHSVKGLEFEVVIMLGMEEGRFPFYKYQDNSKEMREAHRLCYVCVSRAKQICILLHSKTITFHGEYGAFEKKFAPSRFWQALYKQFGNEKNLFTQSTY